MFKRLLAALGKNKAEPPPSAASAMDAQQPSSQLIHVRDDKGRQFMLTRESWRDQVLLPNLEKNWDDADALYRLVLTAMEDGFAADVLPAARRQLEIDHIPERAHTLLGIALMEMGKLDEAEAALRAGCAQIGETAALLTNLAKVHAARGDSAASEATLWQAVCQDVDFEPGLMTWLALHGERGGADGYRQAIEKLSTVIGGRRAHLTLARYHLQAGDLASARGLYREVVTDPKTDERDIVTMICDLANNGHVGLVPELVVPVYQPVRHDPVVGLNLLRAFHALRRREEGEALLSTLRSLEHSGIAHHLDHFTQAFAELDAGIAA